MIHHVFYMSTVQAYPNLYRVFFDLGTNDTLGQMLLHCGGQYSAL